LPQQCRALPQQCRALPQQCRALPPRWAVACGHGATSTRLRPRCFAP
jgi:hypothetical protein